MDKIKENIYEIIAAFLITGLIVSILKMAFYPINGNASNTYRSNLYSPCQCKMRRACTNENQYYIPKTKIYNDETTVDDYDKWGRYIGKNKEVPEECKL